MVDMSTTTRASLLSILGLFLIAGLGLTWLLFSPVVSGSSNDSFSLKIKRGMSFDTIVGLMLDRGILKSDQKVRIVAKVLGYRSKIKAGKYEIAGGISSYELLKQLVLGKVTNELITIPEGKTARQIAALLQDRIEIDSSRFMQLVNDANYIQKLGVEAPTLEGFLFPDTYNFYWGMNEEQVIRIMVDQFKASFSDTLLSRAAESDLSVLELITLASIIEGESVVDSERRIISAVYRNRLKRGMRLQADPTIQYIVKDGPRRLLNRDLRIDSPYNTYLYPGLPPGPINNPGLASIRASLYPAEVDYLYFVANGDGSHTFSRSLREHLRAKARFDRHRKRVKLMEQREKKNG